jgi:hypothetical protein
LVPSALLVLAVLLVAAGYLVGMPRARRREKTLRTTIDYQDKQLALAEHALLRRSNHDPVTALPSHEPFQ